ncbi:MAG: DUF393 domain-containing protein [Planctomycetota bacterium]|nr:MAG: DUF393 domain-containing protein [Planctomycetota bacterium]
MKAQLPVLLFDGQCGYCRAWVDRWISDWDGRLECRPFQTAGDDFPHLPPEALAKAIHFVNQDGSVSTGAEAIFRATALVPGKGTAWWWYRHFPPFAWLSHWIYAMVARNRVLVSSLMRWLVGPTLRRANFEKSRPWFLRGLAVIHLVALISFWVQAEGLIGEQGLRPWSEALAVHRAEMGGAAFWQVPTLLHGLPSDWGLSFLLALGCGSATLLLLGWYPRIQLLILWAAYLSIYQVGAEFMDFQWDALLVETTLLAIFWAPPGRRLHCPDSPNRLGHWCLRLLLFRLVFFSGWMKWTGGDPAWSHFLALENHFVTQPLPHHISWYWHSFPAWFQRAATAIILIAEMLVPWLILGPRRVRRMGVGLLLFLFLGFALSGNYGFFPLLNLLLLFPLLEVDVRKNRGIAETRTLEEPRSWYKNWIGFVAAGVLIYTLTAEGMRLSNIESPTPLAKVDRALQTLRSINRYGLFAEIPAERLEIVVEGSADGESWQEIAFLFKPGAVFEPPKFATFHIPRLDWSMAVAASAPVSGESWFYSFLERILEGSPAVASLLAEGVWNEDPPKQVRSHLYRYSFGSSAERRHGRWWRRQRLGIYSAAMTLRDGKLKLVKETTESE